ncbi:hypothetical protein [Sulfuricurvum sp.]|uniref:hypothetical protein n=1 Tax=Sulfuricurvum sp. TaxID=2025608 RepID=UPI003562F7A5
MTTNVRKNDAGISFDFSDGMGDNLRLVSRNDGKIFFEANTVTMNNGRAKNNLVLFENLDREFLGKLRETLNIIIKDLDEKEKKKAPASGRLFYHYHGSRFEIHPTWKTVITFEGEIALLHADELVKIGVFERKNHGPGTYGAVSYKYIGFADSLEAQ